MHLRVDVRLAFLLASVISVIRCETLENTQIHLELLDLDLEDWFDKLTVCKRDRVLNRTTAVCPSTLQTQIAFNKFVLTETEDLTTEYSVDDLDLPPKFHRKWEIFSAIGDSKLPTESWEKLSKFKNSNEDIALNLNISCKNGKSFCNRQDVWKTMSWGRNASELQSMWSAKQELFAVNAKKFPEILELIPKAAKVNGFSSGLEYWEHLVELPGAYDLAKELWTEIEPFYLKLHEFVRVRLEKFYGQKFTEIPVHLLGSEFGEDWSNIADIVLPHRYLYDEVLESMRHDKIKGRKMYEITNTVTNILQLSNVPKEFWKKSIFNASCPANLLIFPSDMYSQLITCDEMSWSQLLEAHEHMARVGYMHRNYATFVNDALRISPLNPALEGLSALLSLRQLPLNGLLPPDAAANDPHDSLHMAALLISALRYIPRLPYYLLSDTFRLDLEAEDRHDNGSADAVVLSWWERRAVLQKVSSPKRNEWDLAGDSHMSSNSPRIGHFLGVVLQYELAERARSDAGLSETLQARGKVRWVDAVGAPTATALLRYYEPLEAYLATAPAVQVSQPVLPRTTTTTAAPTVAPPSTVAAPIVPSEIPQRDAVADKNEASEVDVPVAPAGPPPAQTSAVHWAVWLAVAAGLLTAVAAAVWVGARARRRAANRANRRAEP